MKPMMRIVHWKLLSKVSPLNVRKKASSTHPTALMRFRMIMGNSVPPQLEPKAMIPRAIPSRCLNQCAGQPMTTPKITPAASWRRGQS